MIISIYHFFIFIYHLSFSFQEVMDLDFWKRKTRPGCDKILCSVGHLLLSEATESIYSPSWLDTKLRTTSCSQLAVTQMQDETPTLSPGIFWSPHLLDRLSSPRDNKWNQHPQDIWALQQLTSVKKGSSVRTRTPTAARTIDIIKHCLCASIVAACSANSRVWLPPSEKVGMEKPGWRDGNATWEQMLIRQSRGADLVNRTVGNVSLPNFEYSAWI